MPDEIPHEKRKKRGRPPKSPPRVRRLSHFVDEWCVATGASRAKAFRWMKTGRLNFIQPGGPGSPREIPVSEYVRLAFVKSVDELGAP
jgi:hypothetical protein